MKFATLTVEAVCLLAAVVHGAIELGGKGQPTKMTFKTPQLDDEEAHSIYLPERLKCDACIAVAHQVRIGQLMPPCGIETNLGGFPEKSTCRFIVFE